MPVPLQQDLASALRTAGSLKQHWGVVLCGKGVGIRVTSERFEETLAVVQPINDAVKLIGELFLVCGTPLPGPLQTWLLSLQGNGTCFRCFPREFALRTQWQF